MERPPRSFLGYVRTAFLWHWNLLACGAGLVFSFLCGRPDVVLPLVGAAEIAYLAFVSTNPRFQKAVDASRFAPPSAQSADQQLQKILSALNPKDAARFDNLRARCRELHRLGEQFRGSPVEGDRVLNSMRAESLDRLLWMFLKLLYSRDALNRFIEVTDRDALARSLADSERGVAEARQAARSEKLLRSLEDKLDTLRQRLDNFDRAAENRELIAAEIDRIEQKIAAVSEMSLSTRDAADIGAQVDGIAAGISATQEAIRGIDVLPTLQEDAVPPLLREESL